MVALTRDKIGGWHARKRIPDAVRDDYGRMYGQRYEVKFFAEARTAPHEARRLFGEWQAETEGRIAAIIAAQRGEGVSLTLRQARALSGQWYLWFLERHPKTDRRHWGGLRDRVREALCETIGEAAWEKARNPDDLWRDDAKVREAMRPVLADAGETAQFLSLKGLVLNRGASALFLDNLYEDLAEALERLLRISQGDYSPDKYAERFPAFEGPDSGITPWQLFETWVVKRAPAEGTVESWTYPFKAMAEHFAERSAASISPEEADQWVQSLINHGRSCARGR